MPFFRVVAAKNNQKVDLTAKFDTELLARESLHKDGYSIIDIRETAAPVDSDSGFFYFEIIHGGKKKSGKIQSTDIFKAYKKLVDELGYQLVSIASSSDASDEEKAYTTAKARESYDEFKRRSGPAEPVKPEEKKPKADSENTDQEWVLAREVKKYQAIISAVYSKLELFIDSYGDQLSEDRIFKIKELLPALRLMRQWSNIDKLRIIGETALVKIGELELELLSKDKNLERTKFLKETNGLLKELGSNKRMGNDLDTAKKKISELLMGFRGTEEAESKQPETKTDTTGFVYFKNLRELSLYKTRLKVLKRELLRAFFSDRDKKNRLQLKKKLLEQNIQIIESRISKKTFSYTKLAKWFSYYEDVFVFLVKSLNDSILYSLAIAVLFFSAYSLSGVPLADQLLHIVFLWSVLSCFVVIFNGIRSFFGISIGFAIFFLVSFALQVNF